MLTGRPPISPPLDETDYTNLVDIGVHRRILGHRGPADQNRHLVTTDVKGLQKVGIGATVAIDLPCLTASKIDGHGHIRSTVRSCLSLSLWLGADVIP